MSERIDGRNKPSWADMFMSRYHFKVTFGKLPDGREPVARVQVISWDYDSARTKAIYTARSMFKDDRMVLGSKKCEAVGYPMYRITHELIWRRKDGS